MVLLPILIVLTGMFVSFLGHRRFLGNQLTNLQLSYLLALFPFIALLWLIWQLPFLSSGQVIQWQINWLSLADLKISLYYDTLSAIFALLVTGIGVLVVVYSGYYFKDLQGIWRFHSYLLLFMFSMLGLILSGNLVTLFIFWVITSIASFLLISFNSHS